MSATTESLLEEIKNTEATLATCNASGDGTGAAVAVATLKKLRRQLSKASEALTEGKTLLKS